jgi:hypothetical protein
MRPRIFCCGEANHFAQQNYARHERRKLLIQLVVWQRVAGGERTESASRRRHFRRRP